MSSNGPIPSYDADLYRDDALAEPYGHCRALRDLGPVDWLEAATRRVPWSTRASNSLRDASNQVG